MVFTNERGSLKLYWMLENWLIGTGKIQQVWIRPLPLCFMDSSWARSYGLMGCINLSSLTYFSLVSFNNPEPFAPLLSPFFGYSQLLVLFKLPAACISTKGKIFPLVWNTARSFIFHYDQSVDKECHGEFVALNMTEPNSLASMFLKISK